MLLETINLCKDYTKGKGKPAVHNASIHIGASETVGLFGESGSGKSTLGLMIAGLVTPTSGEILYSGRPVRGRYKGEVRRDIQILFQHPETSFNPMLPLIRSMTEPYHLYKIPYTKEILLEMLKGYGLYEEHLYRKPFQLSGGELQRAALARIMIIKPRLIVLDEPTSMLDVITQAQMIGILRKNQEQNKTAYLFIAHNRLVCDQFCSRIYHIRNGHINED